MPYRDLANSLQESAMFNVVSKGVESLKKDVYSILPEKVALLLRKRTIHIHDLEFYSITYNCIGVNASQLFENKVSSFSSACRELFRGIISLTNRQSGGIGLVDFDSDMAKYVFNEKDSELENELYELMINLNTFVRKGSERAYVTINFGLDTSDKGRRVTRVLLKAFSKRQFIFPNMVFKVRSGVNRFSKDPNFDLFELSCEVTSIRMNPTYLNIDASFNKDILPQDLCVMGCRTRVVNNRFHNNTSLNRGNIAAVTINLPQIALNNEGNLDAFLIELKKVMEVTKISLLHRFNMLIKEGNFSFIKEHSLYIDSDKDNNTMLRNGSLAIGFIGLWDAMKLLFSDMSDKVESFFNHSKDALKIIALMRDIVDKYCEETALNFSLLASSAEGVSGFFSQYDALHYKNAKSVCDKGYYTNSFHIPVDVEIDCFNKILLEAPFHALCNGGSITYIELGEVPLGNKEAIYDIVNYAFDKDIGYFGINFPLNVCLSCGKHVKLSEVKKGVNSVLCPYCGESNILQLRRVSGYLSSENTFTKAKLCELNKRVAHIGSSINTTNIK